MVEYAAPECDSNFIVLSYPRRNEHLARNAMFLARAAHPDCPGWYSCFVDPDHKASHTRQAARWDSAGATLTTLAVSGVELLLLRNGESHHPVFAAETRLARQFFKVFQKEMV